MLNNEMLYFIASDISLSEQKQNDIFLSVGMRIASTRPNGNMQGVTEAFIDEIVNNPEKYVCVPLYADVNRLCSRDYHSLGHMYDPHTGRFSSTQIGGIYSFNRVEDEYGISLMGEARIPKREQEVCQRLIELFSMGMLKFSYEIKYSRQDTVMKDGVVYVDASENNSLTGVAVVSVPAYKESTATTLVAEEGQDGEEGQSKDVIEGVDTPMTLEEAMTAIAERDGQINELKEQVSVAEAAKDEANKKTEALENEKTEKDEALTKAAEEKEKCAAELEAAAQTIAEKDAVIAELTQKVAELEGLKAELDAIKAKEAADELKEKQEKAKTYAVKQGLDVEKEEVANAIASLNYEAIAEYVMQNTSKAPATASISIAGLTGNGMKIDAEYGGMLERRSR